MGESQQEGQAVWWVAKAKLWKNFKVAQSAFDRRDQKVSLSGEKPETGKGQQ